jgi:hypothetical protein
VSTQGVARQGAHVGKHLGGPQAVHSDFALGSSELECGGGRGRGGVDHLDEVVLEFATVLESTADEVGVGRSRAGVQAGAGEVEDGRDTVGLDGFTAEVLGALEVCKDSFEIESVVQNGGSPVVLTLDVDDGTPHPAQLAGGPKDVAITWVGETDVGLGVLAEANLAQEARFFQGEGVLALVEELVGTVESLIRAMSILNMYE